MISHATRSAPRRSLALVSAMAGLLTAGWCANLSASETGLYAGASFVQTKFDHDWAMGSNTSIINVDDEDQGYKVLVGWRPIRWFALEASHADLGGASSNTSVVCVAAVGFPCPTKLSADVRSTQIAALGLWPAGDFDLFARLGANYWDADARIADGSVTIARDSEDDVDVVYGAGAQYRYERLALRLEYEHIALGESDADVVSLGVTYSF
ncbi:outer membrane beta-barrel protein [Povalibacter sp.]|uniref:outer membrane beta-barrel protein n=1 Tax=Povalibacter sp. TaxID=1962978 RepID=UPI002F4297D8